MLSDLGGDERPTVALKQGWELRAVAISCEPRVSLGCGGTQPLHALLFLLIAGLGSCDLLCAPTLVGNDDVSFHYACAKGT